MKWDKIFTQNLLSIVTYINFSFVFVNKLRAGNCCLRHPFSPVLKPRQGGGILLLNWVTMLQDIMPASMPSLQYRHEAAPRHGAMCRGLSSGGLSGQWVYLSLAMQYIPCPTSCSLWVCLFTCLHVRTLRPSNTSFYPFLVNFRNFRNSRWGHLRVFMPFL